MSRPHFAQDPMDPLLTTREAAQRLGVSLRTVQLWVEAGTLPAGRTPGGHRRIRLSAVEALAHRSGLRPAAPTSLSMAAAGTAPLDLLLVASSVDQLHLWQEVLQPLGSAISIRGANNGYTGLLQLGRKSPDLLVTEQGEGSDLRLVATLKPEAQKKIGEFALKQNITTLHPIAAGDMHCLARNKRGGRPGVPVLALSVDIAFAARPTLDDAGGAQQGLSPGGHPALGRADRRPQGDGHEGDADPHRGDDHIGRQLEARGLAKQQH